MQITEMMRENDGDVIELAMTITASADEVDEAAESFFADIAKRDIPGFRKGKAPRELLEQSVGGHLNAMGGIAETLINTKAFDVIDGADVIFIEEPQFNVNGELEEGKPFSFTVSGAVAPVMGLSSVDPVAIAMPPEEATDADVAAAIEELQDHYHTFDTIKDPDHKAEMGDYVSVTLTVKDATDRVVAGLRGASRMIGLGTGTMPESFDAQLIGAKKGDELEFDFEAKDEEGNSDFGDGNLHAFAKIEGFRTRNMPEVDDELAGKAGCIDVEDLYKQMRRAINYQKSQELPRLMVDRSVNALVERLEGAVPDYYVDYFRQDVGREYIQALDAQGTSLQQWMLENAVDGDAMKERIAEEAVRRAKVDCALEALFAAKGWEVTDADVAALFEGEDTPGGTLEEWKQARRVSDLRKMCRRAKATRWLVDNAEVTVEE